MVFYAFLAMVEQISAHMQGLEEEVLIPGETYEEAEKRARIILGERYRGATTVPATAALIVRF